MVHEIYYKNIVYELPYELSMKVRRWGGQGAHTRKKKNPLGIFAAGGALVPAQEKKKKT